MASTSGVDLSISGLASGFDWKTMVSQLASAERAPEAAWQASKSTLAQKNNAYGSIKSYLNNLQADVQKLKDATLYNNRSAQMTDATIATASADSAATVGTYTFNISQLATTAQTSGTSNISNAISPDGNLSSVTVGTAGFSMPVTAGTFSINGKQVAIASTDSLQQVFDNIAAATGNAVTASYNSTTDKMTLTSASPITLGSAADTSNFLQVAQLYNNGAGAVSSTSALGRARVSAAMADSDLATAITDGGGGAGGFTINGVLISYNVSTDTVQGVLDRINSSTAGVNASYDLLNNHFVLANKTTGDVGISMHDETGNFLAATGLSGGTFTSGQNLLYTINGGSQLQSRSNTITSESSTITGLSVTALAADSVTVNVGSDTSAIKSALTSFISDYNNVQSYITTQSASSTDSAGNVTAGLLTGDLDAGSLASTLRSLSFSPVGVSGLSGTASLLANLGIQGNGQDNTITLNDSTALDSALSSHLNDIKSFFSDSAGGMAVKLDKFLTNTVGDSGTLTAHQTSLTQQSTSIDTQIANQEKIITTDSAFWTSEFQAMELAQSQINQELATLTQQISNGTL
jgi:flagellar hook-associated protein 2